MSSTSKSQQLAAIGGPVELISQYTDKFAARLANVLEKRHAVKKHLGKTDDEAEAEIARICASFEADIRMDMRQLVLDAYAFNRYVKAVHKIEPDAPDETRDIADSSPELKLKDTRPFGPKEEEPTNPGRPSALIRAMKDDKWEDK